MSSMPPALLPHLPPARLLIVEDHPLYRDGLLALLQRRAPQLQCQAVEHADAALSHLALRADVDLLLADHQLPGGRDGLSLLVEVGERFPTVARVLVSGSEDPHLPEQARRAGLMGFLPKGLDALRWEMALVRILGGEPWFPHGARAPAAEPGPTPRQATILAHLADGWSNKTIARELGITERTVKYHLAEIYGRLGAANRAEAVARAGARGWVVLRQGGG